MTEVPNETLQEEPSPKPRPRTLPSLAYNLTTLVAGGIAATSLGLVVFLMILEAFAEEKHPYMGILTFIALPAIMIVAIVIAIIGIVRESRRRHDSPETISRLPRIDLNLDRHRRFVFIFSASALAFIFLSAFGSYKAYEYTESNEFCGQMCHTVMHPEFTAYENSPHARVHCVECHIGPGAEWFVRSKISGAYQVYAVMANVYPRPIETPIKNLRPSADTCEQCHWPAQFYDAKFVSHDYYLPDEENTHMSLDLLMKVGGGSEESGVSSGIHYHMYIESKIEYVARDERRQEIPWVRTTSPDGTVRVYRDIEADFDESEIDPAEIRVMDCIDCHNRPSHKYGHPAKEVNRRMALGQIDPNLPNIKALAVDALEGEYGSTEEAQASIAEMIRAEYEESYPEVFRANVEAVDRAIEAVQNIYTVNYFPTMSVSWKEFPDNIGHLWAPGCFRCHEGNHESDDGRVITRDCTACHTLLSQEIDEGGMVVSLRGVDYQHPEDIGEAWREMSCVECHGP